MAAVRASTRLQVGSSLWISEERTSALQISEAETEEFTFSARNELDWLNEHMAEIFDENQLNVAEIFKTPGKLRGKTPLTARKRNPLEARAPLSDMFSATPRAAMSPLRKIHQERAAPSFQVAEDIEQPPTHHVPSPKPAEAYVAKIMNFDSGYHGSQASVDTEVVENAHTQPTAQPGVTVTPHKVEAATIDIRSDERRTTEGSFQSAKEEQTVPVVEDESSVKEPVIKPVFDQVPRTVHIHDSPTQSRIARPISPQKKSPERKPVAVPAQGTQVLNSQPGQDSDVFEDVPSDSDSPARPTVRKKSSLNFASLPAREPLTSKKSIGNRTSRTSHLEQSRISHYGRNTGGKSIGGIQLGGDLADENDAEDEHPEMTGPARGESKMTQIHNKTYTQRLQDQITMLGQSQSNAPRPSKSIPNAAGTASQFSYSTISKENRHPASPTRTERSFVAPGAFPDDEDDDWIGPPTAGPTKQSIFSPRSNLAKTFGTDLIEGVQGKDIVARTDFNVPKQRRDDPIQRSPERELPYNSDRPTAITKSVSASVICSPRKDNDLSASGLQKGISVSNPTLASTRRDEEPKSPSKSPSRSYRDSPLKAAKAHLSSILKTSKGLFASSAAASAGAMASTLSPPPTRIGNHVGESLEDVFQSQPSNASLYPTLNTYASNSQVSIQTLDQPESPSKKGGLWKTKEKDAQVMAAQLDKLGKEREKEAEKARIYSQQEKERVAAMERQVAAQKEQERLAKLTKQTPTVTRSSPRKTKAQLEAEGRAAATTSSNHEIEENVEMVETQAIPPAIPRAIPSQIGKSKDQGKRPLKPSKEPFAKPKQAPVVIRVNTGSRPFQPSNAALAASLQDSLPPPISVAAPQAALRGKQTGRSLHPKASTDSMRSLASSTNTKVKALEAAARKKEQDDREAQRKREAKQELANQIDAKKNAQKALERKQQLERAMQDRPPPPASRPLPASDLENFTSKDKPLPPPPSQRGELGQSKSIMAVNSVVHRPQEELGRSINSFQNTTKAPPKRPLPVDETQSRTAVQRNGPNYQQTDNKRRKTLEDQDEEMNDAPSRGAMAPPVRQSGVRQKDGPTKLFSSGYVNAPHPSHGSLHKPQQTISQHMHQPKPAHPMDMVQTSKATINFAPNPAHTTAPLHKTPARPAGPATAAGKSTSKSVAKSSPRYQNGENIDLPEIHTDSEDSEAEGGAGADFAVPDWANSPALAAGIMRQEGMDPAAIFGPPGELKMEEVFKNKERWGRFRARTSSANWSGSDRLTEEEVQRDLIARERLRREGGWSYGLS